MNNFLNELAALLNRHGKDAETNTADYILADMLNRKIDVFANTLVGRSREGFGGLIEPSSDEGFGGHIETNIRADQHGAGQ